MIKLIKKWITITVIAMISSMIFISPARSDTSTDYIAYASYFIERNTYQTLLALNSFIMADKSDTSANLQAKFTDRTNAALAETGFRNDMQERLIKEVFKGINANNLPIANDLDYQTLWNKPFFALDPRLLQGQIVFPGFNYIKNVAGANIKHPIPSSNWKGTDLDKNNYSDFYSTIMAIESFNTYILSQMGGEASNNHQALQNQSTLMQQASSSDWFTQVASENIGIVFRQMLMYDSQIYVLLTELLENQRDLLSAQAMTNTLLILGNQFNETQLLNKAKGGGPKTEK